MTAHPYGAVDVRDTFGAVDVAAPHSVTVTADERLRLALAVYREGLNAASPFYRFLAFWNVIEAAFGGNSHDRDSFLGSARPAHSRPPSVTGDVAAYLRDESGNAIAHVVRADPSDTSIDPDLPSDRERLDMEGRWMQDLARGAITSVWPKPVVTTRRGPVVGQSGPETSGL
jgi:hypothetical protein